MIARLDARRESHQAERDYGNEDRVARIQPDRGSQVCKATNDNGGEGDAGDEQEIEKPPIDVFAADEFPMGPHLDIRQPAQPEHSEAQHIRQEFWYQASKSPKKLGR